MPTIEQRLTALEVAMVERTAEQQRFKAENEEYHSGIDARIDSLGNGLMEHRREAVARFDEVDRRFDQVDGRFNQMDGRFNQMDGRLDQVDGRLDQMDGRLGQINDVLARVAAKLEV